VHPSVRSNLGEMLHWRNVFWGLSDALARTPGSTICGRPVPSPSHGGAYQMLSSLAYSRVRELVSQSIASGLIYVNSHARDFDVPELRPYIDRYIRGSNGMEAVERVKIMKLLWDCVGTEFAGRHELYERNYSGSYESIRTGALDTAEAAGVGTLLRNYAGQCMTEYDTHGWTVPDLVNSDDVNLFARR
jgi:4-hydroxyphenylacetate 3-monooxygenase